MRDTEFVFDDFDPEWTHDEAKAAGSGESHSPYERWVAWLMLGVYERCYERGEKEAVLEAVRTCAKHGLPMPNWLATETINNLKKWANYEVKTLDEAFGVQRKKGIHINAERKKWRLEINVPIRVAAYQKEGRSVDQDLFDEVGKELGVSGSSARDAYYNSFFYKELQKTS
ncbi:MAG: hypothetical protein NVV73_10100 [Cellvibrionaceae bacterium]|nr:hypothetical protein [Cellvibrionaceae bacterium]